jgi:RNA polymerase sigma factor (sigma-70 family)
MKEHLIDQCIMYQKDIFNFIYKMTYNAVLSEDISQETYIKAIKGIDGFNGRSELKTWLFTIAKNEVYRSIREQKKDIKKIEKIRKSENANSSLHELNQNGNDIYIDQIKNGCLFALINCLPFNQRCAFILHELNYISVKTISEILGKSVNSIRILIMRSKKTIRHFLCTSCEYMSDSPQCKCLNMLNFSLRNDLIQKIMVNEVIDKAKSELRRFRNEIELLKSLPNKELDRFIKVDSKYQIILFKK